MINRIGDRPVDRDPSAVEQSVEDHAPSDEAPSSPWTRVLGILVLGSFAAATKTARMPRREPAAHRDPERRPRAAA